MKRVANALGRLNWGKRACAVLVLCAMTAIALPAQTTYSEVVLHSFGYLLKGANPGAAVIRDSAGNLYGTAPVGGTAGNGVVFKLSAAGKEAVQYSFTGGADGGFPVAAVARDSAGNLYGTTYEGGSAQGRAGAGVVFKVDTAGQEAVLYTFTGGDDGGTPNADVILDSAGNLYGTTYLGGAAGAGVVYKVDTSGHEDVLYSFTGAADGSYPSAGLIRDSAGNLYGTTYGGGVGAGYLGYGVVFQLDTGGNETALYTFTGGADGGYPEAGVIRDSSGNLYGTTDGGGTVGYGVVFKLTPAGKEKVLYSFTGGNDGGSPNDVIRDSAGNLYGTTFGGGAANWGVVYQLNTAGQETVLYTFTGGADGGGPESGLIRDSAGNLYGTVWSGGAANLGVVYKLDATGRETVLYSFPGPAGGGFPYAAVTRDSAGNLYGTTQYGGTGGAGVVYRLSATGHETVLYNLPSIIGAYYYASNSGVVHDSAGNLYGTMSHGGTASAGVVYKLGPTGQYTALHSFTGGADGGYPYGGLILDSTGNLYGTTSGGGTGAGVVFKLDTGGNESVLYSFTGGADGSYPSAGVIRDSAGNLYGTTVFGGARGAGVVYKLDTAAKETVVYSFTGAADGGQPNAGVFRDSAGNLYGTTAYGGSAGEGFGVVYRVDTSGNETVLHTFTGGEDGGAYPRTGVVRDSAGNLYGTISTGGASYEGLVYKLDTANNYTVLYSFTGGADGCVPDAGVILDSAGNLYGTTNGCGAETGVVFKLAPQ